MDGGRASDIVSPIVPAGVGQGRGTPRLGNASGGKDPDFWCAFESPREPEYGYSPCGPLPPTETGRGRCGHLCVFGHRQNRRAVCPTTSRIVTRRPSCAGLQPERRGRFEFSARDYHHKALPPPRAGVIRPRLARANPTSERVLIESEVWRRTDDCTVALTDVSLAVEASWGGPALGVHGLQGCLVLGPCGRRTSSGQECDKCDRDEDAHSGHSLPPSAGLGRAEWLA